MTKTPTLRQKWMETAWLDIAALLLWGGLLLKYVLTGQLRLLIHPNYTWLSIAAAILLILMGLAKLWQQWRFPSQNGDSVQHMTILPKGWGSSILILVAIAGFLSTPSVLVSQTAIQRGLSEGLPITRSQPQQFRTTTNPENRSLIDWIRTLNAYPEPDAYAGQAAKITGFVTHLAQLPDNYIMVSRFVITCCAVDAYPVGLPVKLKESRKNYPPDTWITLEGIMTTETLSIENDVVVTPNTAQRQLVIAANKITKIPTPSDPYDY